MAEKDFKRKLLAILSADVVGYSRFHPHLLLTFIKYGGTLWLIEN
jgi:hypothetical protein